MMFAFLVILACCSPPQFASAPLAPPQFSDPLPCGKASCDCGCAAGDLCTCRPDGMKARSIVKHATYAEWKAATAKKRGAYPPGLAPRPVVVTMPAMRTFYQPAFMPSFAPSFGGGFAGAACAGGG